MDRLTVITRAALALRARRPGAPAPAGALPSIALVEQLCAVCCAPHEIMITRVAAGDAMLGGARARLHLWNWEKPDRGGTICVQRELSPEDRAFSIAHELGHFMLHRGEKATPCPDDGISEDVDVQRLRDASREGRVEEYNPKARRELEANAFAAELLAPGDETRALFLTDSPGDVARIAAFFGVSTRLARARLVAAVLSGAAPEPAPDPAPEVERQPVLTEDARRAQARALLAGLDTSQREAATAPGPALVVAGPGTGKTATLVGRVAYLSGERGASPETILALTFSNRAADEMRERLIEAGLPGERAPVMTIHAFATELLRRYARHVPRAAGEPPLPSNFRILDRLDQLLLLEELLPKLKLRRLRALGDVRRPLPGLLNVFSRARDRLLTPEDYHARVEAMALAEEEDGEDGAATSRGASGRKGARKAPGTFTADEIERAREQARAYAVWDRELRLRGALDYGGLIQSAVAALRAEPDALAEARSCFPHVLVDEFQDTNEAAGELLFLLAGERGAGLWVVGDRNQSIYRWRGASPVNLPELARRYPRLAVRTLRRCYRSVPDLVRLGSDMAGRMATLSAPPAAADGPLAEALRPVQLDAERPAQDGPAVWRGVSFPTPQAEREAIIADMRRRHEAGLAWGEMAALCYKSKHGRALAAALAARGVPATARGEFFERDEIKDLLALPRLAEGRDAGGLLRARGLLALHGVRALTAEDERALGRAVRSLAREGARFPWALRDSAALRAAGAPESLVPSLQLLGEASAALWWARGGMGYILADALLRPGGLAWRLGRIAAGHDAPAGPDDPLGEPGGAPARAQDALAALGALISLAGRFDLRWRAEPGFRGQLSGLASSEEAEEGPALEDRGADGDAEMDAAVKGQDVVGAEEGAAPSERIAPCFLRYVEALLRAGEEITIPVGAEDAAHILTIHGAKGLEFPAVYLHCLAPGGFSSGGGPSRNVDLLADGDAAAEDEAERRSVLYVAATRARDALIVTRALSYGKSGRQEPPLAAATILDASEVYAAAAGLPAAESEDAPALPDADGDDEGEDDETGGADETPVAPESLADAGEARAKPEFPYYALALYLDCPRRFAYREQYHLRDSAGPAANAFHVFVRRGLAEQRRLRAERPGMTGEEARRELAALWDGQPGARAAYHETYKEYALDMLDAEWERAALEGEGAVAERLEMRVALREVVVSMNVDAIITRDPDGDRVILERWHTARPSEKDASDPQLPLMLLGYRQRDPGARVSVRLVYLGAPLGELGAASAADRREAASRRQVVDVTEKAREYVSGYLAGKGRYKRLFKLDEAARRIAEARFAPRRGEHCATCPYVHICPGELPE